MARRLLSSCGAGAQGLPVGDMWDLSSPTRDQTCVPCIERWIFFGRGEGDFFFLLKDNCLQNLVVFCQTSREVDS